MKKQSLILASLLFVFLNTNLHAASITINTRAINQGVNNSDFIDSWGRQTSSITTNSLNEFTSFRSGRDSLSHLSVDFFNAEAEDWGFQAGLDAHYGAALYIDGNIIGSRTDDLWWSTNWNHGDVMSLLGNSLLAGAHTLDVYWAETCCDGPSSMRFTTDGANWEALSVDNLNVVAAAAVPEPLTIGLFFIGLIGLVRQVNKNDANKNHDHSIQAVLA